MILIVNFSVNFGIFELLKPCDTFIIWHSCTYFFTILVVYPPLQTDISHFCEMKYLPDKETHNKNEENTLKECESTLFYTIIHYFTLFYTILHYDTSLPGLLSPT